MSLQQQFDEDQFNFFKSHKKQEISLKKSLMQIVGACLFLSIIYGSIYFIEIPSIDLFPNTYSAFHPY